MDVDIVRWAESQIGFYVDRTYRDGKWVLGPAPIRLSKYHANLLRYIFTPDGDGRLPYDTVAWCEPAKSGKSAIAGLCAQYMGLHGERNSSVVMASNKQNQAASVMFASFVYSVEHNPALRDISPTRYDCAFPNGCTVRAIPSNSRGEAGARFSLALFDELWGYVYQDAERLFNEFKTDPTRQNCLKLAIGYAGYHSESQLWQDLLEIGLKGEVVPELAHITNDDGSPCCWASGRNLTFWSHVCRQPWQTDQWIDSQRRSLRDNEFARMVLTRFVESTGDFIDFDTWEGLIDPAHEPLLPGSREPIYVGLDLAVKPGGDDCALVALCEKGNKVAVAFHRVWLGGKSRKADLQIAKTVKPLLFNIASAYNLAMIALDPWQAMGLAQDLRRAGLPVVEIPQTHKSRSPADTGLWQLARAKTLALYDHPQLKSMTGHASAKELSNGLLFIQKGGRGKIDLLVAMSNALAGMAVPRYTTEIRHLPRVRIA